MTSKLQVTIPKAVAGRYGITPGAEIDWLPAGDAIRVVPRAAPQRPADPAPQLRLFDRATEQQRRRDIRSRHPQAPGRPWVDPRGALPPWRH